MVMCGFTVFWKVKYGWGKNKTKFGCIDLQQWRVCWWQARTLLFVHRSTQALQMVFCFMNERFFVVLKFRIRFVLLLHENEILICANAKAEFVAILFEYYIYLPDTMCRCARNGLWCQSKSGLPELNEMNTVNVFKRNELTDSISHQISWPTQNLGFCGFKNCFGRRKCKNRCHF